MSIHQVGTQRLAPSLSYTYEGEDALSEGMALCLDTSKTGSDRWKYATKPNINNLSDFVGVVRAPVLAASTSEPRTVDVIPPGSFQNFMKARTNQNVASGDLLGLMPGSYNLAKWTVGRPILRALEAVDRSSAAGLVSGLYGVEVGGFGPLPSERIEKHWDGANPIAIGSATVGDFILSGTSAVVSYPAAAAGAITVTSNTTNQAQIALVGEPFSLAAEACAAFRCKFQIDDVGASMDFFVGLSITDTSYWSTKPTDYMGFTCIDGALAFDYVKDGTGGAVTNSLGTLGAATDVDCWFFYDGEGNIYVYTDVASAGTKVAHTITLTSTEIPNDERLTLMADILGDDASAYTIKNLDVWNYA